MKLWTSQHGFWELNPGPLEGHRVLLTTEPSLQPNPIPWRLKQSKFNDRATWLLFGPKEKPTVSREASLARTRKD